MLLVLHMTPDLQKGVFHTYSISWTRKTIILSSKDIIRNCNFLQPLHCVGASCWPNLKSLAFTINCEVMSCQMWLNRCGWKTCFRKSGHIFTTISALSFNSFFWSCSLKLVGSVVWRTHVWSKKGWRIVSTEHLMGSVIFRGMHVRSPVVCV